MGRRSKLTPEKQKKIAELIAAGNTRECAAGCVGVDDATLYRWLADNREFRDAIEKADAEAEARNVLVVQRAAATSWQAGAWWLERRRHQQYAKREYTEAKTTNTNLNVDAGQVNDATRKQLREIAKQLFGEAGPSASDED